MDFLTIKHAIFYVDNFAYLPCEVCVFEILNTMRSFISILSDLINPYMTAMVTLSVLACFSLCFKVTEHLTVNTVKPV